MANKLEQQYPQFFELNGIALNDGYVYIGVNGLNPETNPIPIFLDGILTTPIAQPLRTTGGYIYYNGNPISIYFDESDYSITVKNSLNSLIYTNLSNVAFSSTNSIDTIEDLATYTESGLVMVKDINRGGTFTSKTEIEIDPNTGSLYVANGGTVFAKLGGGFWARQYAGNLNVKWWNAKGDGVTNDTSAINACWSYAPNGSKIDYDGNYLVTNLVHPLKVLHHYGTGAIGYSPTDTRGTTIHCTGTIGLYMPPPDGLGGFCRFSSFNNMVIAGNGTTDSNGTNTCLKINNQGTMLNDVETRYGNIGVECNTSTSQMWNNCKFLGATNGVIFKYDATTPYSATIKYSWASNNIYINCFAATSTSNTNAKSWYVDATCQYAQNTHINLDCESGYIGLYLEGRMAAKDTVDAAAYGASGWQNSGNIFQSCWFEANTSYNIVFSYDSGSTPPAATFYNLYQDTQKIFNVSDSLIFSNNSLRPLGYKNTNKPQGSVGQWGSPITANQYVISGAEVNSPLSRNILNCKVPYNTGNRNTSNFIGSYDFEVTHSNVPLVGATASIFDFEMPTTTKSLYYIIEAVGTDTAGNIYALSTKILAKYLSTDTVSFEVVSVSSNGTQKLFVQPIRKSARLLGLYVWKDATVTNTVSVIYSVKVVVGADTAGQFGINAPVNIKGDL